MFDRIKSAFRQLAKAGQDKLALAGLTEPEKALIQQIVARLTYLWLPKLANIDRETRLIETQKIAKEDTPDVHKRYRTILVVIE